MEELNISELKEALRAKKLSSVEAVRQCLKNIESTKSLNALIHTAEESALKSAEAADKKIAEGVSLPLLGLPIVLKDNIAVRGLPMTCASRVLEGFVPSYDAVVTKRLREAGAVIIGKANMDEFAMGCSGETSAYGASKNPFDYSRTAGGSSGGSAAAVAAGQCLASLGTDTGGSARQPASFCGLAGLKPTYGAVSRDGIAPVAGSMDQAGVIAKNIKNLTLVHSTITDIDVQNLQKTSLKGKKLGIIKQFSSIKTDNTVNRAFAEAVNFFERKGARIVEYSLQGADAMLGAYMIIACAEIATNMARFDGIRYGSHAQAETVASMYENTRALLGKEVKKRILFGNHVLKKQNYEKLFICACKFRTFLKSCMAEILSDCDAVISPTTPTVAFEIGGETSSLESKNSDVFLSLANLTGLPALTVPCKNQGLPAGLQIIGAPWREGEILSLALSFEEGIKE